MAKATWADPKCHLNFEQRRAHWALWKDADGKMAAGGSSPLRGSAEFDSALSDLLKSFISKPVLLLRKRDFALFQDGWAVLL